MGLVLQSLMGLLAHKLGRFLSSAGHLCAVMLLRRYLRLFSNQAAMLRVTLFPEDPTQPIRQTRQKQRK